VDVVRSETGELAADLVDGQQALGDVVDHARGG
jgi:hypothetical protein